jgi:hypothetical protein
MAAGSICKKMGEKGVANCSMPHFPEISPFVPVSYLTNSAALNGADFSLRNSTFFPFLLCLIIVL